MKSLDFGFYYKLKQPTGKPQGKYWITRIPTTLTILQAESVGLKVDSDQPLPMKPSLMSAVVSKRYFPMKSKNWILFIILFFMLYSCQKEKISNTPDQLKISEIFTEQTYSNDVSVYTNDSLFCIYIDNNLKAWKNGLLLKNNKAIFSLIKGNGSTKIFKL